MGLITETNEQYYAGSQAFLAPSSATSQEFTTTFDTDLVFGSYDPSNINYPRNNFKLYTALTGVSTYTEYVLPYTVSGNKITITGNLDINTSIVCQLKKLDGGKYGNKDAFGTAVEENYNEYSYIKLNDLINNFLVAYVGAGKLIPSVKRTDVVFFAKRGLQEFSYDTLKSIKSQELTVPPSLSLIIPQDYINYVKMSWVDTGGVKHIIYPTRLTSNPTGTPIQDGQGVPIQDNTGTNIQATSIIEERWENNGINANSELLDEFGNGIFNGFSGGAGADYGLEPELSQANGWFTINERENKFSFSNDMVNRLVILEYISDGLASDLDTKVPKLAEEAMYAHLSHAILATRANQPEYVINRLNRQRVAKLRNAKIRLSSIKIEEITQVMRGKSKIIK